MCLIWTVGEAGQWGDQQMLWDGRAASEGQAMQLQSLACLARSLSASFSPPHLFFLPPAPLAFPRLPVTLLSPPWIQGDKLRSEDLCVPRCLAAILSLAPRQAGTRPRWHRASTWWDWWPVSEA